MRGSRYRNISPEASRPGATRSHQMSEAPAIEFHARRLLEARARERDQLIGQIFQVCAAAIRDVRPLRCEAVGRAAAIDAGGAGGRDLRLRASGPTSTCQSSESDREFRRKDCEHAPASHPEAVRKPRTTRQGGCCCFTRSMVAPVSFASKDKWRLEDGAIAQLMNRRVYSVAWRAEATSSRGVKELARRWLRGMPRSTACDNGGLQIPKNLVRLRLAERQ